MASTSKRRTSHAAPIGATRPNPSTSVFKQWLAQLEVPAATATPQHDTAPQLVGATIEMAAPGSSGAAGSLRELLNRDGERTSSGTLLYRATSTATSTASRPRRHKRPKPLGLLPLVALCFYDVSGGPFGIEVSLFVYKSALITVRRDN